MDKILIRGVNWVGDCIMSIPAIRGIRKLHANAKISLLIKEKVSEIFKWENSIDEIIVYKTGLSNKLKLIKDLRDKDFSRAYLLQNAFDAALITYLARIPERVGYARDLRGFLLTHPIVYRKQDRNIHHIDYFFEIPKRFNPSLVPEFPFINIPIEEKIKARQKLSLLPSPILAISPGARYGPTKRWEPEKFIEIIKKFTEHYGSVVLLGNRDEDLKFKTQYMLNLIGKTSLSELISIVSECDLLLCNDSGVMHIGYATGTPLVAIFGSTSPELTGPPRGTAVVVKSSVSCAPCFKRSCSDIKCMKEIQVAEVWNALEEIIPKNKAIFFDRDGTLCKDANYLRDWKDFEVYQDIKVLRELKELGFLLIGVTNQSGIARGIIKEDFVKDVNKVFIEKYGFDDFFYCPHHPDERCFCRKPNPGMALLARYKYKIDFKKSFVVGDKDTDIKMAHLIGAKGIQIGKDAKNLKEVVEIIKRNLNA